MNGLSNCPHCGGEAQWAQGADGSILARCTGCGIQTQPAFAALEYAAKDRVAAVWNAAAGAGEWPDWIQPTGAHDAYYRGAKVSHGGAVWISNIDNNVWQPGVSGWTKQTGGAA